MILFKYNDYIYVGDDGVWPDANLEQHILGLSYEAIPCYNTDQDELLMLDIVVTFLGSNRMKS